MAVSRSPDLERGSDSRPPVRDWLPSDRYDLVLAVIPLLFLAALVVHVALGLPVQATLLPTALVGVLLVVDAVYLNPPTTGGSR